MPEDVDETELSEDESDEAEPEDPLVTHLFEQLEDMRQKLYQAEMRCAVIESETREEVTREMEGRMRAMERMFSERVIFDAEQNEAKIDSKIDLVNRAMMISTKRMSQDQDDSVGEVEDQLISFGQESNIFLDDDHYIDCGINDHDSNEENTLSDSKLSEQEESGDACFQAQSDEWVPSDDGANSSESSMSRSRPTRSRARRTSSAQRRGRSSASAGIAVRGSIGKENSERAVTAGTRPSCARKTPILCVRSEDDASWNSILQFEAPNKQPQNTSKQLITTTAITESSNGTAMMKAEKTGEGLVIPHNGPRGAIISVMGVALDEA
ncbi:hypothetical protein DACRYDRAFT_119130, partial [Dacryopinax primogenitus]